MILVASTVVMLLLGYALVSVLTQRLVSQKEDAAFQELDRARTTVEQQIDATGTANSVQVRINSARASLGQLSSELNDHQETYEAVVVVDNDDGTFTTSPEGFRIPEEMRTLVSNGNIAQQYTSIDRIEGETYNALLVGTPIDSDIPDTQVYLVLSMESEEATMALMRGLLSAAGVVVVVLLVGIAWLATQQVIVPIRSASRIAQRLAAGHLRERMVVNSDDEMGRLAASFNDMADKLSKQITQLEEYGDLQRQFTSDVSHELRTPLTTVRMAADLIAADSDSMELHTRRASELMIRELDRFEELLADLLEISRHDAGVADLSAASLDVRSCVDSAMAQVVHLAEELDVDVQINMPAEPVTIEADSRRIERILRNLLANAIDHSEESQLWWTWLPTKKRWALRSPTPEWGSRKDKRSWCSTASGAPMPRVSAIPAARAWAWRLPARTPCCMAVHSTPSVILAWARVSGLLSRAFRTLQSNPSQSFWKFRMPRALNLTTQKSWNSRTLASFGRRSACPGNS